MPGRRSRRRRVAQNKKCSPGEDGPLSPGGNDEGYSNRPARRQRLLDRTRDRGAQQRHLARYRRYCFRGTVASFGEILVGQRPGRLEVLTIKERPKVQPPLLCRLPGHERAASESFSLALCL